MAMLLERWVRRIALGGDQRRGVARLGFGEGPMAGAELVVMTEPGGVSVELRLPPSMPQGDLEQRLLARLTKGGRTAEVAVR
jgi:hypothetical protein